MTTTVSATNNAPKVLISDNGAPGNKGPAGNNGAGLNNVRKFLLDNPLCWLFKTNDLAFVSAPSNTDSDITWSRSTTATYIDRYNIVNYAAINEPREEKEGFLLEGASTNTCLHSVDFLNAAWNASNFTIISTNNKSPDGTLTATYIKENAPSTTGGVFQNISVNAGLTYTFSFFAKRSAEPNVNVRVFGNTSTTNFINESYYGSINSTDFTRIEFTFTATHTEAVRFYIVSDSGAGTVDGAIVWGAQVEVMGFASSYIPTTVSGVTRSADFVSAPVLNNLISRTEGDHTQVFNYKMLSNQTQRIYNSRTLDNNSEQLYLIAAGDGTLSYKDASTNAAISGTLDTSVHQCVAVTSGSNMTVYADGEAGSTVAITEVSGIDTAQTVTFGNLSTNSFPMYGHISNFRVYDFALNQDEIDLLGGN